MPHGAHEQFAVKARVVRFLVEQLGFRAVALEEDWTRGRRLDEYIVHGIGDPRQLLSEGIVVWHAQELLDLLTWLRAFNDAHTGAPVRFVGADILASRGDETAEEARRTYGSVRDRALPAAEMQGAKVVLASHAFYACP